jgi:phage-related protein
MRWDFQSLNAIVMQKSRACRLTCRRDFCVSATSLGRSVLRVLPRDAVKHLEGKLWELRMTGRDGIARAIYLAATGRRVIVVRVFVKKTQKTPRHELELARERAKGVT